MFLSVAAEVVEQTVARRCNTMIQRGTATLVVDEPSGGRMLASSVVWRIDCLALPKPSLLSCFSTDE